MPCHNDTLYIRQNASGDQVIWTAKSLRARASAAGDTETWNL